MAMQQNDLSLRRKTLATLAAAALATSVAAQQGSQKPKTPPEPHPPVVSQMPTFRTAVSLIRTDVTVVDKKTGIAVPDLTKDDFVLLEDGVPQTIQTIAQNHGGKIIQDELPPPVVAPEGMIFPPSHATNDVASRIFIIFIDDNNIEFKYTGELKRLLMDIKKTLIHEGDMLAIVSTGPSSIAIDQTYDRNRIDEAVDKASGNHMTPEDMIQGAQTSEGPAGLRYQAGTAFLTAYDILRNLEQEHNRRKAFIYISSGYDFDPFPNGRNQYQMDQIYTPPTQNADGTTSGSTLGGASASDATSNDPSLGTNPFGVIRSEFAPADLMNMMAELTREANRANVTFYTIDPRGMITGPDINDDPTYVSTTEFQTYLHNTQDTLRVIADQTHGFATVDRNDLNASLKRIDADMSDYYILGYMSSNPDPLRKVRKIEIRIKRKGDFDVSYRPFYTLPPPEKPAKPIK